MSNSFSFDLEFTPDAGGTLHLTLRGPITEDATTCFEDILNSIQRNSDVDVIFHMAAVTFLNSIGIQLWMRFLDNIPHSHEIALAECPPEVVGHLNHLRNFAGRARVQSIQVPYSCNNCQKRLSPLVSLAEIPQGLTPTAPLCTCGDTMEIEEPEEEYFFFLSTR